MSINSIGLNSTEGEVIRDSNYFLEGKLTNNLSYYAEDLNSYSTAKEGNISLNINTSSYNITLASNTLTLYFKDYNGLDVNVTGYWSDGNRTENFTNTTLAKIAIDLVKGRVRVMFGKGNISVVNYSQYYEYENNWIVNTRENLTVLDNTDTSAYIKVIDESGNPIDDALVRASYSKISQGGNYSEMGQRFTGSEGLTGMTYFVFDSNSDVALRFMKDSYETRTITFDAGANTYTQTNPLVIPLKREGSNVLNFVNLVTYKSYSNETEIPMYIYAPSRNSVKYNTNYRMNNNQTNVTIPLDNFKTGTATLTSGTDYLASSNSDIIVSIYIDGSFFHNYTITYKAIDKTKFTTPTGLDTTTKIRIGWLFLIIISGVIGLIFKGDGDNGTGRYGKGIFLIGCLILPIIFVGEFLFLIFIIAIYGIGKGLKRWISE